MFLNAFLLYVAATYLIAAVMGVGCVASAPRTERADTIYGAVMLFLFAPVSIPMIVVFAYCLGGWTT